MKRFLFVLSLLAVFYTTASAKIALLSRPGGQIIVLKTDTLAAFNLPKSAFDISGGLRNDTLFLQYVKQQDFYEIKDGSGVIPLTRDKQMLFKVVYPAKEQPIIKQSEVLTDWEPMSSIYFFWLLIIGINALFGLFYKGKKMPLIVTQSLIYGIVLAVIIYLQAVALFSYEYFILLNVFILLGVLSGIMYHDAFNKEFRLVHIVFGTDVFILLWNAIYVIMPGSHVFALPPKAFLVSVFSVIISPLVLVILLFIRQMIEERNKKVSVQESEKIEEKSEKPSAQESEKN